MKKISLILLTLCITLLPLFSGNLFCSASDYPLEEGCYTTVISSKCDLYLEPSFISPKITVEENIISVKHNQQVKVISVEGDFALIKFQKQEGYVYKYYLKPTQNTSQYIYPVTNATIRNDTKIYDLQLSDSELPLAKKNTRVYLYNGFDDKKEYTSVQIVLESGELYNGFIKTADIKPDGVSGLLIAGISIIAASVTVILSLVFIKKKKKSKKKEPQTQN